MGSDFKQTAMSWTGPEYDMETRMKVNAMLHGDQKELEDAFYRTLEFGTGGLRGIMGAGTNRMNKYTVGMATQGFANYLIKTFPGEELKVAVSFDSRHNSREFAKVTSEVFAANEIHVYLFDNIRPTPELSFAIRELRCQAGVMITASHNPKEYNGYKAYWEDGAQITAPHDVNIINEVNKINSPSQVHFGDGSPYNISIIGENIDKKYLDSILSLTLSPQAVKHHEGMKMVYTPLHGCGVRLVPRALKQMGFTGLISVPEQDLSDGDFPTVVSPNPEEPSAMKLALELAAREGADLVMATDPDADRMGIAIRDDRGELVLLNGNQTASILTYYILTRWQELGKINDKTYIVKTIVTTELIAAIAHKFDVKIYDVLTGFKYIAEVVRHHEGKETFICGGEESFGFNVGEFVRDKDAVIACAMIAECAAWVADKGITLYQLLQQIYKEFGLYREKLVSVTKKGMDGVQQIKKMMTEYRVHPPQTLGSSKVTKVIDYNEPEKTGLPKSNVVRFFSENGSVVSVRPSGTEPKIKFYFGAVGDNADTVISSLVAQFSEL